MLSQANANSTAIFVDELDARGLEGSANGERVHKC
jgi:hypothetical protein